MGYYTCIRYIRDSKTKEITKYILAKGLGNNRTTDNRYTITAESMVKILKEHKLLDEHKHKMDNQVTIGNLCLARNGKIVQNGVVYPLTNNSTDIYTLDLDCLNSVIDIKRLHIYSELKDYIESIEDIKKVRKSLRSKVFGAKIIFTLPRQVAYEMSVSDPKLDLTGGETSLLYMAFEYGKAGTRVSLGSLIRNYKFSIDNIDICIKRALKILNVLDGDAETFDEQLKILMMCYDNPFQPFDNLNEAYIYFHQMYNRTYGQLQKLTQYIIDRLEVQEWSTDSEDKKYNIKVLKRHLLKQEYKAVKMSDLEEYGVFDNITY